MPRRSGEKAEAEVKRARQTRWKYLIRNHQFREEVRELRTAFRQGHQEANNKRTSLISKWNLTQVPDTILQEPIIPDDIPRKLEYYKKFLDCPPFGYPVEALSPLNASRGRYLNIKVDLTEPVDLILHFISETLREYRPGSVGKRRLDKADRQLEVFDLYEFEGKDFEEIARELQYRTRTIKGRRNTIRSAYVAAKRKIYGSPDAIPDEDEVPHIYENCPICSKAKKEEEFCRLGRKQLPPLLR
jgi:hypothetical protein